MLISRFAVLEAFVSRSEHGAIENFYSLCEADAVLADILLIFCAIPLELPGHSTPQCNYMCKLSKDLVSS